MQKSLPAFISLVPELVVLFTTISVMLFGLYQKNCVHYRSKLLAIAMVGLGITALYLLGFTLAVGSVQQILLSGAIVVDNLAIAIKMFLCILIIGIFYFAQYDRQVPDNEWLEFILLALFSMLGAMVAVSAYNLLPLYLGLELLSLPLYAMIVLNRTDKLAIEAGVKYFVIGAIASGTLLYGMSLIYGLTGSLNIPDIVIGYYKLAADYHAVLLIIMVLLVSALSIKLALAPFHMWLPDVYQGPPTVVALFVASVPKIAVLGITFRIITDMLHNMHDIWSVVFSVLIVLSLLLGNIQAILQQNIRRMLAYSGIGHMGFILLGLITYQAAGYAAALLYMFIYALMTLAIFALIILFTSSSHNSDALTSYRGLATTNPYLALLFVLVLLSMAGIPPFIGFFAKLTIIWTLLQQQYTTLAIIAMLSAVIGSYYYLRIIWLMYFEQPLDTSGDQAVSMSRSQLIVISCVCFSLLLTVVIMQYLFTYTAYIFPSP